VFVYIVFPYLQYIFSPAAACELALTLAALCEDGGGECGGCLSELRVRPGVFALPPPPPASVLPLTRGGVLRGVACLSEAGREEEEAEEEEGGGVTPGDGSRRPDVREDTRLFLSGLRRRY